MKGKGLLVILDGLGDRPVAALEGRTPLEAAATPWMDALAARGTRGLTDPLEPGVPVDTPTGTALLLGVPRSQVVDLARGPVESAGVGLDVKPGDVAIRCNFATVERTEDGLVVRDRRAGRIRQGRVELADALSRIPLGNGVVATVRPASQHRAVLHLAGAGLSAAIRDTDPGARGRLIQHSAPLDAGDAAAERTAALLNRFTEEAHAVLTDHPVNRARIAKGKPPANGILARGAGMVTHLDNAFGSRGLRVAVVAGERTVIGLARLLGFQVEHRPEFTGMPDSDFQGKVSAALAALEDSDVVILHFKAPDICAHDHDPEAKRDVLERIDRALSRIPARDLVVAVCGDHCTDSTTGKHSGDPVPALLAAPELAPDPRPDGFHEGSCARGGLGRVSASDLVARFLTALKGNPA